jgi:hypothetical protein
MALTFRRNPLSGASVVPDTRQTDAIEIDRLLLAAWLRLNDQELLGRRLLDDGKMIYVFRHSSDMTHLIEQWDRKTPREAILARFSRIVSFEIRKAVNMRRAAGMPLRIRSSEKH